MNIGSLTSTSNIKIDSSKYQMGVLTVLGASLLSGISAAFVQRAFVHPQKPRNPMLLSAELAFYGIIFLLGGQRISRFRPLG